MAADVALLTDSRYEAETAPNGDWYLANILSDDGLLRAALSDLGVTTVRLDWRRSDVDWSDYRSALFRTTWDYFDRFDEFSAWLARVRTQTRLCNDAELVEWNMDKHYLADLESRGVPVVPTRFVERGTTDGLRSLLEGEGWHEAVVKPCVSGAARHTYRLSSANVDEVNATVAPLLASESFMLQPFQPAIVSHGEDSLMVFGGRYSHAVRKTAKAGDFRVQDDHGGVARACEPTAAQIELAEQAMSACQPRPVYGRVDMIRDGRGGWMVMELELIEPELWLRFHPPAATAFARAFAATL